MLSSKIGLLSEFLYSVLRFRIMICFSCEVVLCLRHILPGTQWTKIRGPSRGNGYRSQPRCHFLPSAVKKGDNVDCHVAARNHLRNVLFNILRQFKSGNGDSDTLDHVQYRLDCLYRVMLGSFDAGIVDERVHCSFHFSLVTDPLFSLQSPSRARDRKTKQPLVYSTTEIEIHVSMFPEACKTWKHAFLSFLAYLQFDFHFVEQDVECYNWVIIVCTEKHAKI